MAYSRQTHTVGRVNSVHSNIPFTQTLWGISFNSILYRLFYLNFSTRMSCKTFRIFSLSRICFCSESVNEMNTDSLSLYHEGFARVKRGRQAVGKGKIGEKNRPFVLQSSSCHLSKRWVFWKFNVIFVVGHTNNARSIAKNSALTAG